MSRRTRPPAWKTALDRELTDLKARLAKHVSPVARAKIQARIELVEAELTARLQRGFGW